MKRNRKGGLLAQISLLFGSGKKKSQENLQPYLELVSKEPMNAVAHLKVAEIYQKQGEKKMARSEYLRAADIFCGAEQYNKGAAIYNMILQQEPNLEFVNLKLADTYKKMGFVGQSFSQYQKLYSVYSETGKKEQATALVSFMAEVDPEKFTLAEVNDTKPQSLQKGKTQGGNQDVGGKDSARPIEEGKASLFDLTSMLEANIPVEGRGASKLVVNEEEYGVENIFAELEKAGGLENSYRDYHYQMGTVCKEMGLLDEAIRQFQTAMEKDQRSAEAAKLLDQCLTDKKCRKESGQASGRILPALQKPLPQM